MSGATLWFQLSIDSPVHENEKKLSSTSTSVSISIVIVQLVLFHVLFSRILNLQNRFSHYIFYNLLNRHDIVVKYELLKCFNESEL